MTDFDEADHPRAATGRFVAKTQSQSAADFPGSPAEPAVALDDLKTTLVRDPGEHPFETVQAPDGTDLGTVMCREGLFIAAVHNGRAPTNVGIFESRDDALSALVHNGGAGQVQPSR